MTTEIIVHPKGSNEQRFTNRSGKLVSHFRYGLTQEWVATMSNFDALQAAVNNTRFPSADELTRIVIDATNGLASLYTILGRLYHTLTQRGFDLPSTDDILVMIAKNVTPGITSTAGAIELIHPLLKAFDADAKTFPEFAHSGATYRVRNGIEVCIASNWVPSAGLNHPLLKAAVLSMLEPTPLPTQQELERAYARFDSRHDAALSVYVDLHAWLLENEFPNVPPTAEALCVMINKTPRSNPWPTVYGILTSPA